MAQTTSIFFQDELLPGVLTEIQQDYNYGYYTTTWGTTSSVLVLGTAFTGPLNKVVKIYSPEHALFVFGNTYDSANHKEASLVTGIQDVYDKGCRSIYACRIAGKDIYKDFELAPNLGYKLRVSGAYPSNECKDMYIRFVNDGIHLKLIYYKPADRSTIYEKMNGVVDSADSMIETVLDLNGTWGYTPETKISELINLFNTYRTNNVLRLSLVKDGVDVTSTDPEAQNLPIASIFSGMYFIGRDKNLCDAFTLVDDKLAETDNLWKKRTNVNTFRVLKINTDINASYPIAGEYDALRNIFTAVTTTSTFDFVDNVANIDLLYGKDDTDYEQVDISGFDLYKVLGSGFATTAHIELKNPDIQNPTEKDYVVKETGEDNTNRIVAISDGLYSMLQNVPTDYRVLAHSSAIESMDAKLPSKKEFLTKIAGDIQFITTNNNKKAIRITPIVNDDTDISDTNKFSFDLSIVADDTVAPVETKDCAATHTAKAIAVVADTSADSLKSIKDGETFAIKTEDSYDIALMRNDASISIKDMKSVFDGEYFFDAVNGKVLKVVYSDAQTYTVTAMDYSTYAADSISDGGKNNFLVSLDDNTFVAKYDEASNKATIIGSIDQVLASDAAGIYVIPALHNSGNAHKIIITEDYASANTYESLMHDLESALGKFFTFEYAENFESYKNEYLNSDAATLGNQTTVAGLFAKQVFDTAKYIPYKTTDNLARQLAQHCAYTSIKTGSTHGIIGYRKISDTSITGIAKVVDQACKTDFDLYAKRTNGKYMLDKDSSPYNVGKNISMTFGCYYVTTADGYKYISTGAGGYAGMISSLPIDQSSTNQPIDIAELPFELTNYQLENLTNAGFVTFKNSYTKGTVVTDGITMAPNTSAFKRLSTTRITGFVETLIRSACEPFIGQQNNLANRNSIKTAVNSALYKIMGTLIKDFDFTITSDLSQQKLGIIDIDYVIVPYYEIRQIRNRITIKDSI